MASGYARCKTCGLYGWVDKHVCPPRWEAMAVDHDDEDNTETTFGDTAENAVQKYAEDNFSRWEYPEEIEIWVRQVKEDPWQKFIVGVQSVPEFHVYPKKD